MDVMGGATAAIFDHKNVDRTEHWREFEDSINMEPCESCPGS